VYDINSAYATAMLAPHPFGASRTTRSVLPKRDADLPRSFVRLVGRSHGALPMRHEDGSLSFPADELPREFFATGHELIAGLETRTLRIERVISCSTFHETVSFAPFIEHYWNERKKAKAKGDRLRDLVAKRTMNGVYGKLAQDPSRRRVYRVAGDAIRSGALEREGFAVLGQLGPWWLYSRPRPAAFGYLNVATAASITGAVRSQLLRAIASAEDPIYCDTDSLACGKLHGQKIGNGLGEWQLEAEARRGWIAGKKLYAIELQLTGKPNASDRAWKLASKGVQLAPEQIVRVAEGDPIEWASEVPTFRIGKEPVFLTRNVQRTGGSNEPARPFAE
jgi:hypothetical protein